MIKKILVKKEFFIAVFVLMLIMQVACMIYFGTIKQGYHIDEVYSYGLSNSYYKPFPTDRNKWLDNSYFNDYLEVGKNDKFKYDSVYYNQGEDVHPPLFYFALHTISSFTPNSFSKWQGIILNIFLFIGAVIALYFLSKKFFKNDYLALLVCFFWGFSIGAISSVVFIRMYTMFTLWVVLLTYLFIKAAESEKLRLKQLLPIFGIILLGLLTQYYFVIFTFFISVVFFIYLLCQKRIKDSIFFFTCAISSILSALAVFPKAIDHLLYAKRGEQAVTSLQNFDSYLKNLEKYYDIINNSLFAGLSVLFLVVSILILIFYAVKKKMHKSESKPNHINHTKVFCFLLIIIPALFYTMIIGKIAPYQTDRYAFPVFPLFVLSFVIILNYIFSLIIKNKKAIMAILCCLCITIVGTGFLTKNVNYLFTDYAQKQELSKNYGNNNCLILTDQNWKLLSSIPLFRNYNKVYIRQAKESKVFPIKDETVKQGKARVVYIDFTFDQEKLINDIKENTHLSNVKRLYSYSCFVAYYFY